MTFEKRKNSDSRRGISILLAIALVLAGLFVGLVMTTDNPVELDVNPLAGVDLSGEWVGTTTQDYDGDQRYDYRVILTQNGNELSGVGILDMTTDYDVYAEEVLSGYIADGQVIYSEVETLVLDGTTMDRWCHTQTTLSYQVIDGQETLVGTWEYVLDEQRCEGITGRVILTRQSD
ncbi:MAG: hypothetical protein AAFV93_07880 [Chloroflexota bacterium]